ncbi:hypothetical protein KRR26_26300 [Corallococcus sp. M34]|uniref:SulP family inorganic anion transporter n=1 Tax=Citreicoccus inhibens TaxID=2849499 RepID=UPI0013159F1C|nr:SulP family inorganic anion transporter [Citreicoccus inhibens]MBU8899130.1 hypothetical protein [Citreicoccus inhibens]
MHERAKGSPRSAPGAATPRHASRELFQAWTRAWGEVLTGRHLPADLLAGITVAAVALPLNLALAVASGLPPAAGLIAGAIGGGLAAIFGGAPLQVTGPAAALNVMVLAIVAEFGVAGAAAAALLIGGLQIAMGLARGGKLIRLVPESVLVGFTTGVGIKLLDGQLPELFGFDYTVAQLAQMLDRPEWLRDVSYTAVLCGLFVAFLVVSTQQFKRFPAALVGIALITALAEYLGWGISRVGDVPSSLPFPALPSMEGSQWLTLAWKVLPLALLAAAESLLAARAVERMAPTAPPPQLDLELIGQGVANTGSALFGGMPVTGVIVRSGVNVQSGAKTRLSALVHAAALLLAVLYLSQQLAIIPLAALAGLLCVVGMRLIELKTLRHLWHTEKLGAVAFIVTAVGTVTGHLVAGLAAGMAIHGVHLWLTRKSRAQARETQARKATGIRAVLHKDRAEARQPHGHEAPPQDHAWLRNIRARAHRAASAFVHEQAAVIGRVTMGEHVHIAAGSSVRADEGSPFFIGDNSNVQDGVVIHALKDKRVRVGGEEWAVYVGRNVSMAHDALVHGPCFIGDDTFVGFKAVVHDSVVGSHCYIGIGAVVVGVEIPDGRFVPHGMIVDTAEKAEKLPLVSASHLEFNEDVVDVNRGLASAYHKYVKAGALVHVPTGHGPHGEAQLSNSPGALARRPRGPGRF